MHNKRIFLATWLILLHICLFAGEIKYPYDSIPDSLLINADAVVRSDEMFIQVNSLEETTNAVKYAVTILNKNAASLGKCVINYDKNIKIRSFKGAVYDASGNMVKRLKSSAIVDASSVSSFSLYEDDRIQMAQLSYHQYPYTVEFEYETVHKQVLDYRPWYFQSTERLAVESSGIKIQVPKGMNIRYKEMNMNTSLIKTEYDDHTFYDWHEHNLKAFEYEPYSPPVTEIIPWLRLSPVKIKYHDYEAGYATWKDYGMWINYLNEGRQELPEETKAQLNKLTEHASCELEKVRRIYDYLQSTTRYVSIQLGIGGFQPFAASVVAECGYGDCKALSNYTRAMLKAVGIDSYYALVRAGENAAEIDPEFPGNQFNHAILFVPLKDDTVWLECTSQTNPFGYLGSFTGNRMALVMEENGGKLVRTYNYDTKKNLQVRYAELKLDSEGNCSVRVKTTYSGLQYENDDLNFYLNKSYTDQKEWLYEKLDLPSFEIKNFSLKDGEHANPMATEEIRLHMNNYASVSGKRLFIKPNLLNAFTFVPKEMEERKTDVCVDFSYIDYDTIYLQVPDEYKIEYCPEDKFIENKFGTYKAFYTVEDDKIIYTRMLRMNKGRYEPDKYNEFREFRKEIVKSDNVKMVLIKKTDT